MTLSDLRSIVPLILLLQSGLALAQDSKSTESENSFVGIWSTHYQTTFVYLIVHSDHTANFILLDQGYSVGQTRWSTAKNGIIVNGFPKFRLWKGDTPNTARVVMQEFPQEATNDTFGRFPLYFYMRKQVPRQGWDRKLDEASLPEAWLSDQPPADFNAKAGMPRPPKE